MKNVFNVMIKEISHDQRILCKHLHMALLLTYTHTLPFMIVSFLRELNATIEFNNNGERNDIFLFTFNKKITFRYLLRNHHRLSCLWI